MIIARNETKRASSVLSGRIRYAKGVSVRTIDGLIDWLRELWKLHEVFAADPGDGEDGGRISLAVELDSDAFAAILCTRLPNRRGRADAQGNSWNHFDQFDLGAFLSQVFTDVNCHVGKSWLAIVG
jgi:hypothetical protein